MIRRPPRSTRTDTLFPDTTLFRSQVVPPAVRVELPRGAAAEDRPPVVRHLVGPDVVLRAIAEPWMLVRRVVGNERSEEHTSELQSLMRISYAVFCLKKKKKDTTDNTRDSYTHNIGVPTSEMT